MKKQSLPDAAPSKVKMTKIQNDNEHNKQQEYPDGIFIVDQEAHPQTANDPDHRRVPCEIFECRSTITRSNKLSTDCMKI